MPKLLACKCIRDPTCLEEFREIIIVFSRVAFRLHFKNLSITLLNV